MLHWFYKLPIWFVFVGTIAIITAWAKVHSKSNQRENFKKPFIIICIVSLFFSIVLIFYTTLIGRSRDVYSVITTPFQSLIDAQTQPEMYRTMLMNVVLFVPFGITLTTLLSYTVSTRRCIIFSMIIGMIFSCSLELIQYILHLGLFQTDDVICNTLGCFAGATSLLLSNVFKNNIIKKAAN